MSLTLQRPAHRPLIIAHRGFRACYPENTPLAFAKSLGRCDLIELDVRLSQDGQVVVFHDAYLGRTSDAEQVALSLGKTSLALVQQTGSEDLVLLSSFVHAALAHCRRLVPHLALAALQEGAHPPDLLAYLHHLGLSVYHPQNSLVDAALIQTLAAAGIIVNVFTVNDARRIEQLAAWGVTGIFTDFPDLNHPGR